MGKLSKKQNVVNYWVYDGISSRSSLNSDKCDGGKWRV